MAEAWALALVGAVAAQRLLELAYAQHTARRITAAGGQWLRRDGYAPIVAVQVLWLAACAAEAAWSPWSGWGPWTWAGLVLLLAGESMRYSSMAALRWRWHTRVYVLPEAPLVRSGPYRWLRHPIYVGVLLEGVGLPLAFGAWGALAGIAVALPAVLLARIRIEERALGLRAT